MSAPVKVAPATAARGPAARAARALLCALPLAGCLPALPPAAFDGQGPAFRPEQVFAGRLISWGVLETAAGAPSRVFQVESSGTVEPDGTLRLDQTVRWRDGETATRTWRLKADGEGRWSGTLTPDATGPVQAEARGLLFHLAYPARQVPGGRIEQWLYLQPDGRTILNEGRVTSFGLAVARLSERITREAGGTGATGTSP